MQLQLARHWTSSEVSFLCPVMNTAAYLRQPYSIQQIGEGCAALCATNRQTTRFDTEQHSFLQQ